MIDRKRIEDLLVDAGYAINENDGVNTIIETALGKVTSLCTDLLAEMDERPLHPCAAEQLESIKKMLADEQQHDRYFQSIETVNGLVRRVLEHKRGMVASVIQRTRLFQEDVMTFLRAFSLMLENVAGASTHGEKAARLRGLVELVETAATRVRQRQFTETVSWSFSMADDVFHCDYPVRHWIQKAREAELRAEAAEKKLAEMNGGEA